MKQLEFELIDKYKSFEAGFIYNLEGDLIILSGINGSGKSQILSILAKNDKYSGPVNSNIKLNGTLVNKDEIETRSYKDNISINEIINPNAQTNLTAIGAAWNHYLNNRLDVSDPNLIAYSDSCKNATNILLNYYSVEDFANAKIKEEDFKKILIQNNFIWKAGDRFTNIIGEIFFNYALKVHTKMAEIGKDKFKGTNIYSVIDNTEFEAPPWETLNTLFSKLKIEYRFKNNYEINMLEINEYPKLFALNKDGSLELNNSRTLNELSDGEKTIVTLCFASLSGSNLIDKKLLLLDEFDAVLNPSLIQIFFDVIKEYFIDKGVMVVLTTHSPVTISLAPEFTQFYEVFKPNLGSSRILKVSKKDYSDLYIAYEHFYVKIEDQTKRIEFLEGNIHSEEDILIITEGKTDWKYFLRALRYFHSKKEFQNISEDLFYKYGSKEDKNNSICDTSVFAEMSDSHLKNYLEKEITLRGVDKNRRSKIRVGIFDSDGEIKIKEKQEYGVFAFKIEPPNISTEFLFSDDEIKQYVSGKRLYIGNEFNEKTGRNINNTDLSLGKDSLNFANKRKVIESAVYDSEGINFALSKENFAIAIYNDEIKISETSWENFRHIFVKIESFIFKGEGGSITENSEEKG